jgi:hypothetical protein
LENNRIVALYPEAAHSFKRQMLPHKKGIPRIVFLAEEKHDFNLDIQIIPIGIYQSHYWHIGSKLLINVGEPVRVTDYRQAYWENPQKAMLKLRDDIYNAISSLTIEIRSKALYEEVEQIREVFGKAFLEKKVKKDTFLNRVMTDRQLVEKLELLEKEHPDKLTKILPKVKVYIQQLKNLKIRNWVVEKKQLSVARMTGNILALLAMLPIFAFGVIFNILPFIFIDRIIRKKVENIAFRGTFFFVAGLIMFPVVYLAELLLSSPFLPGIWVKLAFLLSLPLTGKVSYIWYIGLLKSLGRCRLIMLKIFKKPVFKELFTSKSEIIEELADLC